MHRRRPTSRYDQAAVRELRKLCDCAFNLGRVAHVERAYLHPERRAGGLNDTELGGAAGGRGIPKDARSRDAGRDLLEQLKQFSGHAIFGQEETGCAPGRAKLSTKPAATGSATPANTTGTERVACSIAPTVEAANATTTSGASPASSAACLRISVGSLLAQRMSTRTLRPMLQPNCCSPCRKAPMRS